MSCSTKKIPIAHVYPSHPAYILAIYYCYFSTIFTTTMTTTNWLTIVTPGRFTKYFFYIPIIVLVYTLYFKIYKTNLGPFVGSEIISRIWWLWRLSPVSNTIFSVDTAVWYSKLMWFICFYDPLNQIKFASLIWYKSISYRLLRCQIISMTYMIIFHEYHFSFKVIKHNSYYDPVAW